VLKNCFEITVSLAETHLKRLNSSNIDPKVNLKDRELPPKDPFLKEY